MLSGVLLLIVLLVACGEDEPVPTPTSTATAPSPATAAPATPTATSVVASAPVITPTAGVTTTESITTVAATAPLTATAPSRTCTIPPDLDLAGYQNLEAEMGCAVGIAEFDPVAINEFGEGPDFTRFMLWFSSELQIYVLTPDGRWQVHPDTWSEEQPTFTCNPLGGEADSPPLPRRGFNKLWCTLPGLQEQMGTITVEERLCQHTVLQRFQQGRLLACYEDATIRYIRLFDDGVWDTTLAR
jgi:hypothetical protein